MFQARMVENRWFNLTVQQLFTQTCLDRPDKTAIIFGDMKITFRDLLENVHRLSQALINLGVSRGDHVVMLPTPCPEFICLYLATLQIGAVINPLNLLWGILDFQGVLERNDPKVIVTVDRLGSRDFIKTIRDSIPDLGYKGENVSSDHIPTLKRLVSLSREGEKHEGFLDFSEVMKFGGDYSEEDMIRRAGEGECTDIQFICQTSGSTGLSKSVLWDHRPPLATAYFMGKNLGFTEEDSYLNLAPIYHNSGIVALNLNLVLAGTTLFLMEQFNPQKAVELIDKHKITTTFGFEAHWQAMKRVSDFDRYDFTIKKALIGGEPKTYDLVREMCRKENVIINTLYAQTENGPLVACNDYDCVLYGLKKYTNGRPLPGVELVIRDLENEEKLPPGKPGEICYRSPFLFKGYYKQEEETKRLFDKDGYFHSGDFGTFDNGYVVFLGRLGGVVKCGGENVSTLRVTSLLMDRFAEDFDDVNTVGVPDPYWGTKVVSWVRLKAGQVLRSTGELRNQCKGS